jgi:hypothetical protein
LLCLASGIAEWSYRRRRKKEREREREREREWGQNSGIDEQETGTGKVLFLIS